jgi:hypothetical protein
MGAKLNYVMNNLYSSEDLNIYIYIYIYIYICTEGRIHKDPMEKYNNKKVNIYLIPP